MILQSKIISNLGRDESWLNSILMKNSKSFFIFCQIFNNTILKLNIYFDTSCILFKRKMIWTVMYSNSFIDLSSQRFHKVASSFLGVLCFSSSVSRRYMVTNCRQAFGVCMFLHPCGQMSSSFTNVNFIHIMWNL